MKKNEPGLDPISSFQEIDRIIHEPARFLIMSYLFIAESTDFLFLQNQTSLTKGNLSSHLKKLEDSEYITIKKEFVGKIPRTLIRLTSKGRSEFRKYRELMKNLLNDVAVKK